MAALNKAKRNTQPQEPPSAFSELGTSWKNIVSALLSKLN